LREGTLDIGLVALPQVAGKGLTVTPWRRDPILAYVPADWQPPARVTRAGAAGVDSQRQHHSCRG
jgi:hypothetical protein